MRQAQLLVWDLDGPLLETVTELAQGHAVWVREVRQRKACLNLLLEGGPGILLLHLGRDIEAKLATLEEVSRAFPEQVSIVVGDQAYPALAGLAWELGARFVLFPPSPMDLLPEVVRGYLPPLKE